MPKPRTTPKPRKLVQPSLEAIKADIERRAEERQERLDRGELEVPVQYSPIPTANLFDLVRQIGFRANMLELAVPPAGRSPLGLVKSLVKRACCLTVRWLLMRQVEYNTLGFFHATEMTRQLAKADRTLGELCAAHQATQLRLHALTQRVAELETERSRLAGELAAVGSRTSRRRAQAGTDLPDEASVAVALAPVWDADFSSTAAPSADGDRTALHLAFADHLRGHAPAIDLTAGHGDLVQFLQAEGIAIRGVEADAELVRGCQERELPVEHGEPEAWLAARPEGRLGSVYVHRRALPSEPRPLAEFLALCWRKLRKGGLLIVEVPNPACRARADRRSADAGAPGDVPHELLRHLVDGAGFSLTDALFSGPSAAGATPVGRSAVGGAFDLRDYRDYAIVGRK